MNTRVKKALKEAEAIGFTTKHGKSHIKLYDPDGHLAMVLAYGKNRDRVPGGSDLPVRKAIAKWEAGRKNRH